jgi:hypothetical protein
MERDLSGERVFIDILWELAERIGRHFESCRRPTSTMVVFAHRRRAKLNELARHRKLYQ